ncbi:hypothetical protein Mterra_00063 [Calidithermus terrae]|uniref:Uncharacterized protein n=1 Tax=Calidithermus terrae TaxID=1408545 RepID=A0A399F462_9DEIN|nr:hypothetical protein [Calidithermus terrae]RIH90840.1 hypothetical protein Mterra_00063 [Calidithermus terrae]
MRKALILAFWIISLTGVLGIAKSPILSKVDFRSWPFIPPPSNSKEQRAAEEILRRDGYYPRASGRLLGYIEGSFTQPRFKEKILLYSQDKPSFGAEVSPYQATFSQAILISNFNLFDSPLGATVGVSAVHFTNAGHYIANVGDLNADGREEILRVYERVRLTQDGGVFWLDADIVNYGRGQGALLTEVKYAELPGVLISECPSYPKIRTARVVSKVLTFEKNAVVLKSYTAPCIDQTDHPPLNTFKLAGTERVQLKKLPVR